MKLFVDKHSIIREIWGKADNILFIFAGASAEFALNKAVDWLYFTGRLPADPLGRLFSTVAYARLIIFSEHDTALRSIDQITAIHRGVEASRGSQIPAWAYRDVLFMLIDYSIRSFEVLERRLTASEKEEVYRVFYRVGDRMQIPDLPSGYEEFKEMRQEHLRSHLICSEFSADLYRQYKKHLGWLRYFILKQAQVMVVPKEVNQLLSLGNLPLLTPVVLVYKIFRKMKLERLLKNAILPVNYQKQVHDLDIVGQ